MTINELIGATASELIADFVRHDEPDAGTARFLLDRLTKAQVVSIVQSILSHPELAGRTLIRIPRSVGTQSGLPEELLTDERTTYWRNHESTKPVLVLANTDDDQGQSLRDVASVGSDTLLDHPEFWVKTATSGLWLSEAQKKWFTQALRGLLAAKPMSLDGFAEYAVLVRQAIEGHGLGIIPALGWALPALRAPRDPAFFNAIPEKALGHAAKWRALFHQLFTKRAVFLHKFAPNQQPIPQEQLRNTLSRIESDIASNLLPVFREFVDTDHGWNDSARRLAELEWERDHVKTLFDGIKVKAEPLGQATLSHFEDAQDSLSEDEKAYLRQLDTRGTREALADDQEFYERHRSDLGRNRTLKAKWDRFVYGQPIECSDFVTGLLRCLERLFEQVEFHVPARREIVVVSNRQSTLDLLEMNFDAARYFSLRYRGLEQLAGHGLRLKLGKIFSLHDVVKREEEKGRYRRTRSTKRSALQIKFTVTLRVTPQDAPSFERSVQLIWTFAVNSILAEYPNDFERIAKHPLLSCEVTRELVSRKGRLQTVDLGDVSTLMPVFRQDRGSLVGSYNKQRDLAQRFPSLLENARREGRITTGGASIIADAWSVFTTSYSAALTSFLTDGPASEACLKAGDAYATLLSLLFEHATGDKNREDFLKPVVQIGCAAVEGGETMAIITPWHPLRLVATAVKTLQFAGLLQHLTSAPTVDFGDVRFFFRDLIAEASHSYYPEVCLGWRGNEVQLLAVSQTCGDYSLMESPIRLNHGDSTTTNEDPNRAAAAILALTKDYLDLQPHEAANFSVVLYNSDTARLPDQTVASLSKLYEEGERVRCQVVLRHRNAEKLGRIYESLLESSERDPDSVIVSETSRDFMAPLRVGIMADQAPIPSELDGPPSDIVFLQDVVARLADLRWQVDSEPRAEIDLLNHVPSRWSKRDAGRRDDLKARTFITCPVQPRIGWEYLRALYAIDEGTDVKPSVFPMPCRQIDFHNNDTREIFDEVHRLGQWVVNHDELLSRRQLRSAGVQIVRYQIGGYDGRNLVVSSKSSLSLLNVLIQKRLRTLMLPLGDDEIAALASRLIDDANEISGDIVMRAAKRSAFANELIGVVLSRALIAAELGSESPCGWFFLDDYASWLGQRQQHIADVLALSPQQSSDQRRLLVYVSEAKFVEFEGLAAARRTSEIQLRETMLRIQEAIFGNPGRLDRDLWLSRIADMLVEAVETTPLSAADLRCWSELVRRGQVPIVLRGYSHVFVHNLDANGTDVSERSQIAKLDDAWQEVFGRTDLRDLLMAYFHKASPRSVLDRLTSNAIWRPAGTGVLPSAVTHWIARLQQSTSQPDPGGSHPPTLLSTPGAAAAPTGGEEARAQPPAGSSPADAPAVSRAEEEHQDRTILTKAASVFGSLPTGFEWALPTTAKLLGNLDATISDQEDRTDDWLDNVVRDLRNALLSYSLQAKVLDARLTPNAALVRFQGTDRLRVEDVVAKQTQLLTTHSLKVIRVSAEPGCVVVAVERPTREVVPLVRVLRGRSVDQPQDHSNQSLVVGVRESDGSRLILSPGGRHAPHTLIAGTTGSGKSVLIQNLVLDIALTNEPRRATITLIDPKQGVDYFALDALPHLTGPIVVEQVEATRVLNNLLAEMDERYSLFRAARSTNLQEYNQKVPTADRLPVRWVVHDEFAEWMLDDGYREVVSSVVQRLGVKARAAGIFMIFAAQRPEDRVMPLQLRDNLGNRLVLRVESPGTSRISLGEEGAERLLGRGHLAARLLGEDSLVYAQVPFLGGSLLEELVRAIRADYEA